MKNQKNHKTMHNIFLAALLPVFLMVVLLGAQPAFAAQSASDALDNAFIGEEEFEAPEPAENDWEADDFEAGTGDGEQETADSVNGPFIFDVSGMEDYELSAMEAQAEQLYEDYGIGIYFGEDREESDQDTISRAQEFYAENCAIEDGVLLFLSPDEYYVYLSGRAQHIFTEEEIDQVWDAFVADNTYYSEGIADYLTYMGNVMESHGLQVIPTERTQPLLVDEADLLTDAEESDLLAELTRVSEKEKMDVAVVTVNSIDGKSPEAFADDYYDYNGYGQGADKDGVLLLISMAERDWHVTTTGFGITAVNDAAIELIEDRVVSKLSSGDYYGAFSTYCSTVDEVAEMARNGQPYTGGLSLTKAQMFGGAGGLSVILGFLIGFVATSVQKKNLKRVRRQHGAAAYIYGDASHLSISDDRFIRRNVTRTRIEHDDDNRGGGGGSTIHFGGSGTMHGGGGGKF